MLSLNLTATLGVIARPLASAIAQSAEPRPVGELDEEVLGLGAPIWREHPFTTNTGGPSKTRIRQGGEACCVGRNTSRRKRYARAA